MFFRRAPVKKCFQLFKPRHKTAEYLGFVHSYRP